MSSPAQNFFKYTLLPGFLPRLRDLFTTGFEIVPYLVAVLFQAVRLLPPHHAYLKAQHIGRYKFHHVMAEAANHLVLSWRNIDQITAFALILVGCVLLVLQIILLLLSVLVPSAMAAGGGMLTELFTTNSPYNPGTHHDIAFMVLDRVFGVEGIFNSCISVIGQDCIDFTNQPVATPSYYPFPIHKGLHALMAFYSYGIFFIGLSLILYFIVAVVAESAQTGTPFGQRFNKLWAPIRIMVFFALLLPLNINQGGASGLNAGQYLTLWTAKIGSNFATNAWVMLNEGIMDEYPQEVDWALTGSSSDLVAMPEVPELQTLIQFMSIVKTCQVAYNALNPIAPFNRAEKSEIQPYLVRSGGKVFDFSGDRKSAGKEALFDKNPRNNRKLFLETNFDGAVEFFEYATIHIRFGVVSEGKFQKYSGGVFPYCGSLNLKLKHLNPIRNTEGQDHSTGAIHKLYYDMIKELWNEPAFAGFGQCMLAAEKKCAAKDALLGLRGKYKQRIEDALPGIIQAQVENKEWDVSSQLKRTGWAGSMIWYNQLAQLNGAVTGAALGIPEPNRYPEVMEVIALRRMAVERHDNPLDRYNPVFSSGEKVKFPPGLLQHGHNLKIAQSLNYAFKVWETGGKPSDFVQSTGNRFIDGMNMFLGTGEIFKIRENTNTYPVAQLSALGKSMMDASIRNVLGGAATTIGGDFLADFKLFSGAAKAMGGFLVSVGVGLLAISFTLFYVLPILPFIYGLFAASQWVKGIFEAMVAMPLWALGHLHISGDGLPGQMASAGYFLLFEIFLRPIMTVIALLASISVFSALVGVLNGLFDDVVVIIGGMDYQMARDGTAGIGDLNYYRGPVDQFFYTAMYTIICYMLGMACFKLVNTIPNEILRWAGMSLKTFQEDAGDPAGEVTQTSYKSAYLTTSSLNSMISGIRNDAGAMFISPGR